jgi:exodeoxyribonuclease-5
MSFTFNEQQEKAMRLVVSWYGRQLENKNNDIPVQPFILQGYAGTGKTTLLKELMERLNEHYGIKKARIAPLAPTNRAAKVLSNKMGVVTRTLFSFLYSSQNEELEFERLRLQLWEDSISFAQLGDLLVRATIDPEETYEELCISEGVEPSEEGKQKFLAEKTREALLFEGIELPEDDNERQSLFEVLQVERIKKHRSRIEKLIQQDIPVVKRNPSQLKQDYDLVACDEASMVGVEQGSDLVDVGIPTILIGDPFQLPPVKAKPFWHNKKADVVLTKIERQKGPGAGIPLAGERLRLGKEIEANDSLSIHRRNTLPDSKFIEADQILCGTHKTRERLCKFMRNKLGYSGALPSPGEKLVAVYNDKNIGIMNGELYTVKESRAINQQVMELTLVDPYGKEIPGVHAWIKGLEGRGATSYLPDTRGKFWFGYAITCHQSQGSEWKNVIVCDEWPGDSHDQWLYTAITRASNHVDLIR